jgi:hypothetical protein
LHARHVGIVEISDVLDAIAIECCRQRELMIFPVLKLANEPEGLMKIILRKNSANIVFMGDLMAFRSSSSSRERAR